MTIYYNPAYSATPYRKNENSVDVGNIYCGNTQLLQRLLFYAGIPFLPVSNEERIAYYHACMQGKVDVSPPFYNSFKTDSVGMGSNLFPAERIAGGDWAYITNKCSEALNCVVNVKKR